MHEGSVANAIIRSVLEEAQKKRAVCIVSITLAIGKLTFLSTEQLLFWLKSGFENTLAEQARIEIEIIPGVYSCNVCHHEGAVGLIDDPAYHLALPHFACSACQSADIQIVRGKEIMVRRIQIECKQNMNQKQE